MSNRIAISGVILIAVLAGAAWFYKTPSEPDHESVVCGGVSLNIEYATTTAALEQGLSGRTNVPDDYGMLFVFSHDDAYGFWMKDMLVPIDIFWLDSNGRIVSIARDVSPATYPSVFYPEVPARYVLETAAGFAEAHLMATGTPCELKNIQTVSE